MLLQKGQNTFIKGNKDQVQVQLYWENQISVMPICLLIDPDGKLNQIVGDEDINFLSVAMSEQLGQYQFTLKEVPNHINKIVFAFIIQNKPLNGIVGFSTDNEAGDIRFESAIASNVGAFIIGEVYRYKNDWKIKAVGQEVSGGKKELLKIYHFSEVDSEEGLQPTSTKFVMIIDSSVYTLRHFQSGQLQKLFQEIYIASSTINSSREMDVWFYAVNHQKAIEASQHNFQTYIQEFYPQKKFFNGMGLENQEMPIIQDLINEYKNSETIFFFICNGELHNSDDSFERISNASERYFWEFITLNEDIQLKVNNARNIKCLPVSKLKGLTKGERHHSLIKPITLWKNRVTV